MRSSSTSAAPVRFPFDDQKAAEAIAYLLSLNGGPREYIWLIKVLYFADRESLSRFGHPICGGRYVSMDHGPVLSEVLDLAKGIRWRTKRSRAWSALIEREEEYDLRLKQPFEASALSTSDMDVLEELFARHRECDWRRLVALSHELPEWGHPEGSSREIPLRCVLQALGLSEREIAAVEERAREATCLRGQPANR